MGTFGRFGTRSEAFQKAAFTVGKVGRTAFGKERGQAMKRAAIYARVSTNNGQNSEMQLIELRAHCEKRGWEIAGEFVDVGSAAPKNVVRLWIDCSPCAASAVLML
jgi:hypothetical protein